MISKKIAREALSTIAVLTTATALGVATSTSAKADSNNSTPDNSAVTTNTNEAQSQQQATVSAQSAANTAVATANTIQQQKTAVGDAQASQTTAQKNLANAQDALTTANQNLAAAQNKVNQLQNKIDYYANTRAMPTFTFTPEQTAATQRFINDVAPIMRSGNFNSNDFYRLSSFAAWQAAMTTRQGLNWQDQNGDDQKIILDLDHLTADQVNTLSKFTAAILNQVRQQLGIAGTVGTAVATSGMGDVAQEVATLYGERTDTAAHHYIYALKKAAFDHGMTNQYATAADMVTRGSNSLGESLLTDGNVNYTNRMTMAQAKNAIARAVNDMLFNDRGSAMGHAMSLLGVYSILPDSQERTVDYVGTSISYNDINFNTDRPDKAPNVYPSHLIHFMQYTSWEIASHNSASERAKQAQSGLTHVLDEYDDIADPAALEQALDDIAVARGEYYRAQTAQANAQKALSTAQAALQTATSDYQAAQKKLNQMQADQGISLSDAQKYGNLVMITPITVTAGQSTSAPQIANGFITPVNSQAAQIFAAFANEPGAEIPCGTTASWADASQLAVDTQRAGNYAEDVLISFPDGSTTTIQAALTVQPAAVTLTDSNEAANSLTTAPASQGQGTATATPQAALLTAGSHQQGTAAAVNAAAATSTAAAAHTTTPTTAASLKATTSRRTTDGQAQLPQTGSQQAAGMGALGLLAGMFSGLLGLKKQRD